VISDEAIVEYDDIDSNTWNFSHTFVSGIRLQVMVQLLNDFEIDRSQNPLEEAALLQKS
jgi:hypothetical protein